MAEELYRGRGKTPLGEVGMTEEEARANNMAFSNMQKATAKASDKMFTESEYNINATHEERVNYDAKAYGILKKLYRDDRIENTNIKDWDFDQYLANLNPSYLKEKFIHSGKRDPDYYHEGGDMLRSVYSDDVDQLILSAQNFRLGTELPSRMGKKRSRENISIKAPEAGQY